MAASTRRVAFVRRGRLLVPYFHRRDAAAADGPGRLAFMPSAYEVAEGAGTLVVSVVRSQGSAGAVSATAAVSGGTAAAGVDFADPGEVLLEWADGEGGAKTFEVTILDDADAEPGDTIVLGLSNPTGGATLGTAVATITIAASDAQAPAAVSAEIRPSGLELWLTCSEVVGFGAAGTGGLALSASGGPATLTYAAGAGNAVLRYAISREIAAGETATLSYVQPGDGIQDADGDDLASFADLAVANNSEVAGPEPGAVLLRLDPTYPEVGGAKLFNGTSEILEGPIAFGSQTAWSAAVPFRLDSAPAEKATVLQLLSGGTAQVKLDVLPGRTLTLTQGTEATPPTDPVTLGAKAVAYVGWDGDTLSLRVDDAAAVEEPGVGTGAAQLDGTDDGYTRDDAAGITGYPFTHNQWIHVASPAASLRAFFSYLTTVDGDWTGFGGFYETDGRLRVVLSSLDDFAVSIYSPGAVAAGWHMVTLVARSATDQEVYLDGASIGTNTTTSRPFPASMSFALGCSRHAAIANFFPGRLDNTYVYDRDLSGAEVAEHYGSGTPPAFADLSAGLLDGLVAAYGFDGVTPSGSDLSGNGRDLTTLGAPVASAGVIPGTIAADEVRIGLDRIGTFHLWGFDGVIGPVAIWPGRGPSDADRDAVLAADFRRAALPEALRDHDGLIWLTMAGNRKQPMYNRVGDRGPGIAPSHASAGFYPSVAPPLTHDAEEPDTQGFVTRWACRETDRYVDFAHDDPATCPSWSIGPDETGVEAGLPEGDVPSGGYGALNRIWGWERVRFGSGTSGLVRDAAGDPAGPLIFDRPEWTIGAPMSYPNGSRAGDFYTEGGAGGSIRLEFDGDGGCSVVARDGSGVETHRADCPVNIHGEWTTTGPAARTTVDWPFVPNQGWIAQTVAYYEMPVASADGIRVGDVFTLVGSGDSFWDGKRLRVSRRTDTAIGFAINATVEDPDAPPTNAIGAGTRIVAMGTEQGILASGGATGLHTGQALERPTCPAIVVERAGGDGAGAEFRFYCRSAEPIGVASAEGFPILSGGTAAYLGTDPGGTAAGVEMYGAELVLRSGVTAGDDRTELFGQLGIRTYGLDGWGECHYGLETVECGLLPRHKITPHEVEAVAEDPATGLPTFVDDTVRNQCLGRGTSPIIRRPVGDDDLAEDTEYPLAITILGPPTDAAGAAATRSTVLHATRTIRRRSMLHATWTWWDVDPATPETTGHVPSGGSGTPADPYLCDRYHTATKAARPRTRIRFAPGVDHTASGYTYNGLDWGIETPDDVRAQRTKFGPIFVTGVAGAAWDLRPGFGLGFTVRTATELVFMHGLDLRSSGNASTPNTTAFSTFTDAGVPIRCEFAGLVYVTEPDATMVAVKLDSAAGGGSLHSCYYDLEARTDEGHAGYVVISSSGPVGSGVRLGDNGYVEANGSHTFRTEGCENTNFHMFRERTAAQDDYTDDTISIRNGWRWVTITDAETTHRHIQPSGLDGPYRVASHGAYVARVGTRGSQMDLGHDQAAIMNTAWETAVGVVEGDPKYGGNSWETEATETYILGNRHVWSSYGDGATTAPGSGDYRNTVASGGSHGTLWAPPVGLLEAIGPRVIIAADGTPRGGDATATLALSLWRRPSGDAGDGEQVPGLGAHYGTDRPGIGDFEYEFRVSDGTTTAAGGWSDPVAVAAE